MPGTGRPCGAAGSQRGERRSMSGHLRNYWRTWSTGAVGAVAVALVASQALLGGTASAAPAAATAPHAVKPNAVGNLDCNGYSTSQRALSPQAAVHRHPRPLRQSSLLRQRPLHRPRRAIDPLPLLAAGLRQRRDVHRAAPARPGGACRRSSTLVTTSPTGSTLSGTVVRDEHLRPELLPADQVHAQQRQQRAARHVPRRRRRVHGDAVLPARLRPVRRLDQLQQHPLVRGAQHRLARGHRPKRARTPPARSR